MTDDELEKLKAKRLAEMQRNITNLQEKKDNTKIDHREILIKQLGYRGLEVLQNAETQFPSQTKIIIFQLVKLIESGQIDVEIDGGSLIELFRTVGLNIRMDIKISVQKDGKFISLADKMKTKE